MRLDSKTVIYKDEVLITKGLMFDIDYTKIWDSKDRWIYLGKILLLLSNFKRENFFNIVSFETLANCNRISVEINGNKENVEDLLSYLNTEVYKAYENLNGLSIGELTKIDIYHLRIEQDDFDYVTCIIKQD